MTIVSKTLLFLALGLIHSVNMSHHALLEDVEESWYDQDSSGSGSKEWPGQDENLNMEVNSGSSELSIEATHLPDEDIGLYFVPKTNAKSFLENRQIFTAVIAGGVTGLILAGILTALLIYKWQDKTNGGYIMGQHVHRDEVIV